MRRVRSLREDHGATQLLGDARGMVPKRCASPATGLLTLVTGTLNARCLRVKVYSNGNDANKEMKDAIMAAGREHRENVPWQRVTGVQGATPKQNVFPVSGRRGPRAFASICFTESGFHQAMLFFEQHCMISTLDGVLTLRLHSFLFCTPNNTVDPSTDVNIPCACLCDGGCCKPSPLADGKEERKCCVFLPYHME